MSKIFNKMNLFKYVLYILIFFYSTAYAVTVISDTSIVSEIQKRMRDNPITDSIRLIDVGAVGMGSAQGMGVAITSTQGIVTLEGTVKTDVEASELVQIAASVPDVIDVNTSKLTVIENKLNFTDIVIAAKVKGAYIRNEIFGNKKLSDVGLNVESIDGVVYLTGTLEDQEQMIKAVSIAKAIPGVKDVQVRMNIER